MFRGSITINNNKPDLGTPNGDMKIELNNGSLVLYYSKGKKALLGAYLVTSFRDNLGKYGTQSTRGYCTLINLETGYPQFEERCSRNTTLKRVLSHLNTGDFHGEQAINRGEFIEVYRRDNFNMDFSFNPEDNEGWKSC